MSQIWPHSCRVTEFGSNEAPCYGLLVTGTEDALKGQRRAYPEIPIYAPGWVCGDFLYCSEMQMEGALQIGGPAMLLPLVWAWREWVTTVRMR